MSWSSQLGLLSDKTLQNLRYNLETMVWVSSSRSMDVSSSLRSGWGFGVVVEDMFDLGY